MRGPQITANDGGRLQEPLERTQTFTGRTKLDRGHGYGDLGTPSAGPEGLGVWGDRGEGSLKAGEASRPLGSRGSGAGWSDIGGGHSGWQQRGSHPRHVTLVSGAHLVWKRGRWAGLRPERLVAARGGEVRTGKGPLHTQPCTRLALSSLFPVKSPILFQLRRDGNLLHLRFGLAGVAAGKG